MVGGLKIPVTSTLTALLYGFANHKKPEAKEYYFWRIADILWNNEDLPEPLLERHPWADLMIKEAIANKYLAVGGSASSGKSHTMAAWGIVNWLSRPSETLVLMTSTTLREARKRIWGSVISLLSVVEGMRVRSGLYREHRLHQRVRDTNREGRSFTDRRREVQDKGSGW